MDRTDFAVIGDGWAASLAVGYLSTSGKTVSWVPNTGARIAPPVPTLECGRAPAIWAGLAGKLGLAPGEFQEGSFLREYRNKSFRETVWSRGESAEARRETRDSSLWVPETRYAPVYEGRFEQNLAELEESIRKATLEQPGVRRIEGLPVTGFRAGSADAAVLLGSGEEVPCSEIVYADRWSALHGLEGLPKPVPFTKNREPMGVLQATFLHHEPVGGALSEAFFGAVHKESGEEVQRSIWGYFLEGGKRSVWTLYLGTDEAEDNHEITKKLRRLKQTLDRMFVGPEWLPAGKKEFMANVADEQVRFEEAMAFGAGEAPVERIKLPKLPALTFLTDGYGPASAAEQVAMALAPYLALSS